MSKAYTLTPRPKDLGAMATFVHRLRYPLRIRGIRHNELLFRSQSFSTRGDSDKRRPRFEDERLEAPTRSGSPYELVEIEDKGKYNEVRYSNVDVFWNSTMVEASEEERARKREVEERKMMKRRGRVFEGSEKLCSVVRGCGKEPKAGEPRRVADINDCRIQGSNDYANSKEQPERTSSLANPFSRHRVANVHVELSSNRLTGSYRGTNGDHYYTLAEDDDVAVLDLHQVVDPRLTWNTALTRLLASAYIDPEVKATITAKARDRKATDMNAEELEKREVNMVPNFSYPIVSARWINRYDAEDLPFANRDRVVHSNREKQGSVAEECPIRLGIYSPASAHLNPSASSDSLYYQQTAVGRATPIPSSIFRDILSPSELDLYREIVTHDPRFSTLLGQAESRQVPLICKLHTAIFVLQERLTDLEDNVLPTLCHNLEEKTNEIEDMFVVDRERTKHIIDMERIVDSGSGVLEGCWARECSLLNTLLHIRTKRLMRRGFVAMRFRQNATYTHDRQRFDSLASSVGSETMAGREASLKRSALDTLTDMAAQDVRILREDVGDIVDLINQYMR
jgi:hypothetical protein